MSNAFKEKYGNEDVSKEEMRKWCQRPGKVDEEGNKIYMTEQHHKDQCDVNKIIKKYDKTGLIDHVSKLEARYGDMTGADFKSAMDLVTNVQSEFDQFPAEIRKRFDNSPEKYLAFMENPENRKQAIDLGLIRADWRDELDGIGEHVKSGQIEANKTEGGETE